MDPATPSAPRGGRSARSCSTAATCSTAGRRCCSSCSAGVPSHDIEAVFISHFHADHFFGLPFLLLEAKYGGRERDITIVGPPGIEERTDGLLRLGYPGLTSEAPAAFKRHFVELNEGFEGEVAGLRVSATRVDHVAEMECFAFRAQVGGRTLAYSGDTTLCSGLLRIVDGADVIVLECSCGANAVHLSPDDIDEVRRKAPAHAQDRRDAPGRQGAPARLRGPARRRRPRAL